MAEVTLLQHMSVLGVSFANTRYFFYAYYKHAMKNVYTFDT